MVKTKQKAPNNRTLCLTAQEKLELESLLLFESDLIKDVSEKKIPLEKIINRTINANTISILPHLPDEFADLIIIDPPYNLNKNFNGINFSARSNAKYSEYLDSWFSLVCKKLKKDGSLYICGDWKCTSVLQNTIEKSGVLTVMNRITWQREKGRGATNNWKNSMEDIWFAVKDPDNYYFNVEAVKQKRRVIAPYKVDGNPKDWQQTLDGNFRTTYPGNFWDDISIPFWSMPENTEHPTQKSEKLYAKLILASCKPGGIVFDPFLGSGTASVTAKKLNRRYCGIELNKEYCFFVEKRLRIAERNNTIQGYADGIFWERNSLPARKK
ncbi:MAG: DNA-methyltransferase [Treponemataceae bacterium]